MTQGESHALISLSLACIFFIVYGSLLPFEPNGLSFTDGWRRFQGMPFLRLGVNSRADWVANLLLYVPLGFLFCGVLAGRGRHALVTLLGMALSVVGAALLALGVEFAQTFFPPRTVSLNDLFAEFTGGALGALLWLVAGPRICDLVQTIFRGGPPALIASLSAYAMGYFILGLFPFDFLISKGEFAEHWASEKVGWFLVSGCRAGCGAKLAAEMLAVVPVGVLLALSGGARRKVAVGLASGALLGVLVEGLQLTVHGGISQGASIATRALGVALGVWLAGATSVWRWPCWRSVARPAILVLLLPYVFIVGWLNNVATLHYSGLEAGLARLGQVHFTPFHYHYFTTETTALVSLMFQAASYVPIGVAAWLWRWSSSNSPGRDCGWCVGLIALAMSVSMETLKLFIANQHPDPTNALIAAVAAIGAYRLIDLLTKGHRRAGNVPPDARLGQPRLARQDSGADKPAILDWSIGLASALVGTVGAVTSPLGGLLVTAAIVVYALAIWRWPKWILFWLFALLPALDLTPWTGRLFWTEFDSFFFMTIGVGFLRLRPFGAAVHTGLPGWLAGLFFLSALASLLIGLLPIPAIDVSAFSAYTSSFNSLRAAKGLLFAIALIPLFSIILRERQLAVKTLALGMTCGLGFEIAFVLWERVSFSGVFNFDSDFRITGSFPGMHIGGAYIEGYLVTALPFVLLWAWLAKTRVAVVLAAVMYALAAYCVMVTYSRGGQAMFVLVSVLAMVVYLRLLLAQKQTVRWGIAAMGLIVVTAGMAAWPAFHGNFSQARLASIGQDLQTRMKHWNDTLNILSKRQEAWLGAGLGSFPAAYFWGSGNTPLPSTYAFPKEGGNTYLRLGSGESLYFEQPVDVEPDRKYRLSLDLRSARPGAHLVVPVCEKALLYSFECSWNAIRLDAPAGQWKRYEIAVDTAKFGPPGSFFQRPVKFSLFNDAQGTLVDIDNVSLHGAEGNLVRNGDFADGMHHWFFSTDSHLSWHAKELFLHVLFEQGWVGLLLFALLTGYALLSALRLGWNGDALGLTLALSLIAFLGVGLVDSLVDETRMGFIFYFLVFSVFSVRIAQKR